jgi:hypothetical protein
VRDRNLRRIGHRHLKDTADAAVRNVRHPERLVGVLLRDRAADRPRRPARRRSRGDRLFQSEVRTAVQPEQHPSEAARQRALSPSRTCGLLRLRRRRLRGRRTHRSESASA